MTILPFVLLLSPMSSVDGDEAYLRALARDTWSCIGAMVHPVTGLPYDNSNRGEFTSVSNVGLYLTSVVLARQMQLISAAERNRRLDRALQSLGRLKTWGGFQQCWNSVETLEPAKHDTWISLIDSGNLAAGLVTVAQAAPEFKVRSQKLFSAMDWSRYYQNGSLLGGFDTEAERFNPEWRLGDLGTDARLAQFFAVASEAAPGGFWGTLRAEEEERHGQRYLKPGWQGGGLFMQYLSGLWLDERGTSMGRSARAFARSQIEHAKAIGSPVWGWSASDNPSGGYLGWGAIRDEVVTPHASALAIQDFPKEVVLNLRALEKLGVRSKDQGFYDAVDWKSKKRSDLFLMLDQSMLFLSLGNHLERDVVRRWFQKDATVQRGRKAIPMFR